MARPNKYNLDYFPLDVDCFDDHKILSIEEDFGVKGGYIAIRIMAMVYKDNGYYLEWPDKFEYTIAKRVGNGFTGALVGEIFNSCIKHDLFDKNLFDDHKIVTSKGIQKRWLEVMRGMRRKVSVSSALWLISSEEIHVSSEETILPVTLSTQKESKVKEIKKKETKEPNGVVPPAAGREKPVVKKTKKEEPPEPHWDQLVKTWFDFNVEKLKVKPSFKDTDPRVFKKIIHQLNKRAIEKKFEWSEDVAVRSLGKFLNLAYQNSWLKEHFLLENLNKQFDVIIQPKEPAPKKFSLPPKILTHQEKQINATFEIYKNGKLKIADLYDDDYDFMIKKGMKINEPQNQNIRESVQEYMQLQKIPNDEKTIQSLAKRFAVIEYFKTLKQKGNVTVFGMD